MRKTSKEKKYESHIIRLEKEEQHGLFKGQNDKLGANIRFLRLLHDETQDELAEAIGVMPAMISYYENSKRYPSRDELYLIAKRYGVAISQLYGDCSIVRFNPHVLINDRENREIILSNLLPIIQSEQALENVNFKVL